MNRSVYPVMSEEAERQEFLWEQYNSYIRLYRTTPEEREMLRRWVSLGHSVYESPGSRYLCDQYPTQDYLSVYRQDQEIYHALKGRNAAEIEQYLREYMGNDGDCPGKESGRARKAPKEYIRDLEHELFFLWEYLESEGLWNEAKEYLAEHENDEIPFEYEE